MKTLTKVVLAVAVVVVFLLVWAPWVTDDYAIGRVVENLGGPDARFDYLGQDIAIKDVPKEVGWLPFGKFVTFP
jgi:hypothetical protein